ncbi:MAG: PRD domain-containing protein [Bulleidia sp.]|nr:PRD domain-containing protein [Bulleidia sp.]
MKAVKKINNNVAVCIDNNGNELIAFGKGIGFRKMPYEITDLSLVERTFYGVSPEYVGLLTEIPHDVFEVASEITDEASSRIQADLNPNLVFTLADHINFAISRYKQNLNVKPPYIGSLPYLHETEYAIGQDALKLITKKFRIMLPKSEAGSIALHLINAETEVKQNEGNMDEASIIEGCIEVIEKHLNRPIDRAGFNCSRFTTHMQYLLHRIANNEVIGDENAALLAMVKENYPDAYACAGKVKEYLLEHTGNDLGEDEVLYLALHINRLASREG